MLAALPRLQFDLLAPRLTTASLQQAEVLAEPGDEFDQIYFPQSGMLSLLAVLRDGKAIETATVGREGVVGARWLDWDSTSPSFELSFSSRWW